MVRQSVAIAFLCVIVLSTRLFADPHRNPAPPLYDTSPKPEAGDDELRKLRKERYNSAVVEITILDARRPNETSISVNLRATCDARLRLAEVALEISAKPEDQVPVLQKLLDDALKLEKHTL